MKNTIIFGGIVILAAVISWSIPEKGGADYDRFKTVGYDKIKYGSDITIIQDKETGCLYGQIGSGAYDVDIFPITDYAQYQDGCK
jgi:hypothetical protein